MISNSKKYVPIWNQSDDTIQDEFEDTEFNPSSTEPNLFDQHEFVLVLLTVKRFDQRPKSIERVFWMIGFTTEGKKSLDKRNKGNIL